MSEIKTPEGQTVTTWADPFGRWHATVIVEKIGNAPGVLETAREAIAEEIRQRGNGAQTEAYLASERYRVEYVVKGEKTPQGIRYEFAESRDEEIIESRNDWSA